MNTLSRGYDRFAWKIHGYPRIEDRHLFIKKTQDSDTIGLIDPHEYPRIENWDRVCEENSRQTKEIDHSEQRLIYEWQEYYLSLVRADLWYGYTRIDQDIAYY